MTETDEYVSVKRQCFTNYDLSEISNISNISNISKIFSDIIGVYKLTKKNEKISAPIAPWANFKNKEDILNENEYFQENQEKKVTLKSKRNEGFYILANKNHVSNYLKKTKFCNIMITNGYCNRKKCDFAHSISEYNFPECVFKDNCKKKNEGCTFKHPKESDDEFKDRTNFKYPSNIK
jgi:hypothetical protein